jgi:hypothetical protein
MELIGERPRQGGDTVVRDTVVRDTAAGGAAAKTSRGPLVVLERIGLGAVTVLLSVNIWTGFPLLALWVGSRFAGGNAFNEGGIVIAIVALIVLMATGLRLLTWLSTRYDLITGRPPKVREPAPWLRSMRSEREAPVRQRRHTNAIEAIVVVTVVAAFIAFEAWFFFFAGSSLPHMT